jgi:hypothetical protein
MKTDLENCWIDVIPADVIEIYPQYARDTFIGSFIGSAEFGSHSTSFALKDRIPSCELKVLLGGDRSNRVVTSRWLSQSKQ